MARPILALTRRAAALACIALLPSAGSAAGVSPSEKCAEAKLAAARGYAACYLKAREKNERKPGSANEAVCVGRLRDRWDAIEKKAGPGVCPEYRRDLGSVGTSVVDLFQQWDLAIRPAPALILYDGGPATGQQMAEDTPNLRCGQAQPEDVTCRFAPAIVSDQSYGPASSLATEFSFKQDVPIVARSGVGIAADWDTFLNGDWDACLGPSAGPDCATPAGVLPAGARWWHGYDSVTGDERACHDWSLPRILLGGETAFVGSSSTDGQAGHPSPWGPEEVACDAFGEGDPDVPHVLCLCI